MANVLSDDKRQQVEALGRLGWPVRRIERELGVRRETASAYLKAAGIEVRGQGGARSKPATPESVITDPDDPKPATPEPVITDPGGVVPGLARPSASPTASTCEPYRELIERWLDNGRTAMSIWQELVDRYGFVARYATVGRFVRTLRGSRPPEARVVIETRPGEEAQVDYGEGPMVRHPETGKYRRTRLFLFTLAHSRKSVRLLTWKSSAKTWAQLHERAMRRLGGVPATVQRSRDCTD